MIRQLRSVCESCGAAHRIRLVTLPGVPVSAALCPKCLTGGVYPLGLLLAHTAVIGGMRNANTWWFEVVHRSLPFHRVTCAQFDDLVDKAILREAEAVKADVAQFPE